MADIDDLFSFISASPSPYHVVDEASRRLTSAGFEEVRLDGSWDAGGLCFVRRGGALVAWVDTAGPFHPGGEDEFGRGDDAEQIVPYRIVGSHTDSPNLRVKPQPDTGVAGWRQLAVEVYGGVLANSWLDRDLGLSGRVVIDGFEERLFRVDRPLLRVPQLAIHLDREISSQGLKLNPQQHLTPVWGTGAVTEGAFVEFLASQVGVAPDEVLSWDVMLHDLTPPSRLGIDESLVAAPRLDNQLSCWAAIEALIRSTRLDIPPRAVGVVCLFDHEEVGSTSATGADGTLLADVLERIDLAGAGDRERFLRRLAVSFAISADGAHATHPNYPERHEPGHLVAVNGGPVIKVNANQRYATDAGSAAVLVDACRFVNVPYQTFVSRNDQPCGSTIGPTTAARLGISTADIGVAQLSMHSARELCGADDPPRFADVLWAFLSR